MSRTLRFIFPLLGLLLTRLSFAAPTADTVPVRFYLDLTGADTDTFSVAVIPPALTSKNHIFQFAATAPGTYSTMDIGRFVSGFRAWGADGREIPVERLSVNQFALANPQAVRRITYRVAETWDTPVESYPIYRMCGTSIEQDHVFFNPHAALGYFGHMQDYPVAVKFDYPKDWELGTPLAADSDGYFLADDFDHLVDSPFLMGRLSRAVTRVSDTDIEVYTYSVTDKISSDMILSSLEDMLHAAGKFLDGLPVERYTFLFHFEDKEQGAWEHSYSSAYVSREADWAALQEAITATASHEFFHIVTPLNIHSEVIGSFNFVTPRPSDHLWFYEGVTEWASDMILLHGGIIDLDEYLSRMREKLVVDEMAFDADYSLYDLARTSYTAEGQKQYINIYYRGAVVAMLLDLELLRESDGAYGLRDLIIELMRDYGTDRPFSERKFLKDLQARTHPRIKKFYKAHIKQNHSMPLEEYLGWVGVDYTAEIKDPGKSDFGLTFYPTGEGLYLYAEPRHAGASALARGDFILAIDEQPVNADNFAEVKAGIAARPVGSEYSVRLIRQGQPQVVTCRTVAHTEKHLLQKVADPAEAQAHLRSRWAEGTYD